MYQQADAANLRLDYKMICQVTNANTHAIKVVKTCLTSLGLWPDVSTLSAPAAGAQSNACAPPSVPALLAPRQLAITDGSEIDGGAPPTDPTLAAQDVVAAVDALHDKGLKDIVHRTYST